MNLIGYRRMVRMVISKISTTVNSDIKKVWNVVTDFENYLWRSDLSGCKIIERGKSFAEYTPSGYETIFTITEFKPFERFELIIENSNISGRFTGVFIENENGGTVIEFTEEAKAKKVILNLILKIYLKKQQKRYLRDLERALEF